MSRSEAVPEELAHVPRHALESYVRTRVLALAGSVSVSRRLGLSPDVIKQAFIDALMEAAHPRSLPNAERDDPATRLQLVFRHDCLSLGCLDTECSLCAQNPHRRCEGNFAGKYLAGDVLKAKCGASIRVEVLDRTTAESVSAADGLDDIRLEMGILDGKEYASLQDGRDNTEEEVTKCILLLNNQHKELLQPGRGGTITEGKMVNVALQRAQAYLPDLVVTGSSEALLSGQKPPFRLFVRAVHSDGTRAHHIRFAVSEAFVVATPRVRTAAKADIPHVDDHVKMLAGLGNQTQQKLMDINAAAAAVGVFGLQLPHNTVTKVGQFKDLIEMADRDRVLCDTLKKVLKLTKGWDAAREHAMAAVGTDNQMRIWYQDDAMLGGLLFKCQLGCVDLDSPVGLLTKREASGDQTTLEATLMAQLDAGQRETLRRLQREASLSWWQPGHPGWAIWPVDSDGFMKGAQAQVEALLREAQLDVHSQATAHAAMAAAAAAGMSVGAGTAAGIVPAPVPVSAALAAAAAAAQQPVPATPGPPAVPAAPPAVPPAAAAPAVPPVVAKAEGEGVAEGVPGVTGAGGGATPPVVVKGAEAGKGLEVVH